MAAEKYPFKAFIEEDKSRYPLASEKVIMTLIIISVLVTVVVLL